MSWPQVKLEDVISFIRGVTFKPDDQVEPLSQGSTVVMRTKNVQVAGLDQGDLIAIPLSLVKRKEQALREGDILISSANSWELVGKVSYVPLLDYEATAGGFISIVRAKKNVIDSRYLYHWIASPSSQHKIRHCGRQTTNISNLDVGRFKDLQIPLPPLAEQKRIAAILDKADAIRRKRQQAIQLADDFLRAVFLDMFGDPVTNPKGWDVVDSGELYLVPPRIGTTTPAKGEGNLVVRVGELGQYNIAFERCGRVQLSEADFDKFVLVSGDTVLARAIGSKNQLGKASYYSGYTESVVIDSHVMRLRPNKAMCNPEWFYRFISSDGGKSLLQKAGGATAVQFNINAKQASKLKIPLPPLDLQNKFIELCASYLKFSSNSLAQEGMTFDILNSLSQKAFRGEL